MVEMGYYKATFTVIFILILFLLYVSSIILSIPNTPILPIEEEYNSQNLEYKISTVSYDSDIYKIIHYCDEQTIVGSIVIKDNSLVKKDTKIKRTFYAENIANLVKTENLKKHYNDVHFQLENLENKSKVTNDLLVSTIAILVTSGLGETAQVPIATFSLSVRKHIIKKSITIGDMINYFRDYLKRDYNFNTAKNDVQKAVYLSRNLEYSIDLENANELQNQNKKIRNSLNILNQDICVEITHETYTTIGQMFIDVGNFLISKSYSDPFSWFELSRNELQKNGIQFVEYGQNWQSEFEDFQKSHDYITLLDSKFIYCETSAQIQYNESIQFIDRRNKIAIDKVTEVENYRNTISIWSKLISNRKWIIIEYYSLYAKYNISKNRPLTAENICEKATIEIEYIKNK